MNGPEIFTYIDLELNQPSNSIIEIGIVVGNVKTGSILYKESIIVNPLEDINPYITDLTGITQDQVNNGITLPEAYDKLLKIHKEYGAFINPVTWGQGDVEAIRNQVNNQTTILEWPFGRRIIDVKTLYVNWRLSNDKPLAGGLAKAMTKVGLAFEGRKHSAVDDAYNTYRMHMKMLKLFRKEANVD